VASSENDPNGKGELEEQLRLLLEELKGLEKDAKEKFRNEILPYLKREIEKLRDRLKEFSPDKEEAPQPQRIGT
jgi:regulator of replication initiation timing